MAEMGYQQFGFLQQDVSGAFAPPTGADGIQLAQLRAEVEKEEALGAELASQVELRNAKGGRPKPRLMRL